MKFIGYTCIFICKITEIYILTNEKSNQKSRDLSKHTGIYPGQKKNQKILGFFKISRDTSHTKIKPIPGNNNIIIII